MKWKFVEVEPFLSHREECFSSDGDFRRFQEYLLFNPEGGEVIPHAGPLRKVRWGDEAGGRGKRGGCRVIYMQIPEARLIFLIHVYSKTKKDDLTRSECEMLGALAKSLKENVMKEEKRKSPK